MKHYTTKEAADFLGVSIRTLKRWRKSGKLVPEKKGDTGKRGGRGKGDKYSESQLKRVTSLVASSHCAEFKPPLNDALPLGITAMTFEKKKFQIKNAADLTAVGGTLVKVIARSTHPLVNYLPVNKHPKGGACTVLLSSEL